MRIHICMNWDFYIVNMILKQLCNILTYGGCTSTNYRLNWRIFPTDKLCFWLVHIYKYVHHLLYYGVHRFEVLSKIGQTGIPTLTGFYETMRREKCACSDHIFTFKRYLNPQNHIFRDIVSHFIMRCFISCYSIMYITTYHLALPAHSF